MSQEFTIQTRNIGASNPVYINADMSTNQNQDF